MAASNDDNKQFRSRSTLCYFFRWIFLLLLLLLLFLRIFIFRCTLICSVFAGAVAVVFNCTARIYLFLIIDRTFIIVFFSSLVSFVFSVCMAAKPAVVLRGCGCTYMQPCCSEGTQKCAQAKMNTRRRERKKNDS